MRNQLCGVMRDSNFSRALHEARCATECKVREWSPGPDADVGATGVSTAAVGSAGRTSRARERSASHMPWTRTPQRFAVKEHIRCAADFYARGPGSQTASWHVAVWNAGLRSK